MTQSPGILSSIAPPGGLPKVATFCLQRRQSLRRNPSLSAISNPRVFGLTHRSPGLNQPPDRARAKLNQGLIGEQDFPGVPRKPHFAQGNGVLYGCPDELRTVLAIAERLIQPLNSPRVQPQCSFNRQSFGPCHPTTIRQPLASHQTATSLRHKRHLLLTCKVALIRMQLMIAVVCFRSFSVWESAAC